MIVEESLVSIYMNSMAVLLVIGLLLIPNSRHIRDNTAKKFFGSMCIFVIIIAVCSSVEYGLLNQTMEWSRPVALIAKTVLEYVFMGLTIQWVVYVDYKLYGSVDQLRRRYRILCVPAIVMQVLLVINMFTGIIFTIQPDNSYSSTVLYDVMMVMEYIYLFITVALIYQYDKNGKGRRVFDVAPMLVPVVAGTLINVFTDYSATPLGLAIGMVFLYFSLIGEWRYADVDSRYYNRAYLMGLLTEDSKEAEDIYGAVRFISKDDPDALKGILESELPPDSRIVHIDRSEYLLLTENGNITSLRFIASMIEDAAAEYEKRLLVSTECYTRDNNKDARAFITETSGI